MGLHLLIVLVCLRVTFIYPVPIYTKDILNHTCFHPWQPSHLTHEPTNVHQCPKNVNTYLHTYLVSFKTLIGSLFPLFPLFWWSMGWRGEPSDQHGGACWSEVRGAEGARIPEAVRPYGPAVPDVDGTFMDAKEAQALLRDMLRLARAAEAFLTSGTRATAGASAGTWESEHSKEWSVLCSGWPKWVQFVVSYVWKGPRCSFKASVRSVVQHVCRAVSVLEFPVPLSRKGLVLEQHPLQSHLSPVHEWLPARGRARIKRPKF